MSDTVSPTTFASASFATGSTSRLQSQSLFGEHMQDALQTNSAAVATTSRTESTATATSSTDAASGLAATADGASSESTHGVTLPRISPNPLRTGGMPQKADNKAGTADGASQSDKPSSSTVNTQSAQSPSPAKQPEVARLNSMDADIQASDPIDAASMTADATSTALPLGTSSTRTVSEAGTEAAGKRKRATGSDDTSRTDGDQHDVKTATAESAPPPTAAADAQPRTDTATPAANVDDGTAKSAAGGVHGSHAGATAVDHTGPNAKTQDAPPVNISSADAPTPVSTLATNPALVPLPDTPMQATPAAAGFGALAAANGTDAAMGTGRADSSAGSETPAAQLAGPVVKLAQAGDGSSSISVSLHPKDLGEVRIRLDQDATGATRIVVAATEPATLRSLMAEQSHLHAALDAASMPTTDRQISFELAANPASAGADSQTSQAGSGDGDGRRGQQPSPQDGGATDRGTTTGEDRPALLPAFMTARVQSYRAGVNITA